MKKLKFSVALVAITALGVLNFTQSERGFVLNSRAQTSSSLWSSFTSCISSGYSFVSSYVSDKNYDCSTEDCTYFVVEHDANGNVIPTFITLPGEKGNCVSGNTETALSCLLCEPISCSPKK